MTVKELKAFLADKPDDMMVYQAETSYWPVTPSVETLLAVTLNGHTSVHANQDHDTFIDGCVIKEITAIVM